MSTGGEESIVCTTWRCWWWRLVKIFRAVDVRIRHVTSLDEFTILRNLFMC